MNELEKARENLEKVEDNSEVTQLKLEIEKLNNIIAEKDKQLNEFATINQKLFLKVSSPTTQNEVDDMTDEEKEQKELYDSAMEKIKKMNGE